MRERGWAIEGREERIAHGEWSRAFLFQTVDAREYVVRFSALDEDFRKDQLAAQFAGPHLPIPRIVEFGQGFDGFYAVSERAHGTYLDELTEQPMRKALQSLFGAIAAMRDADVSTFGSGYGVWDANGNAPNTTWRDTLLSVAADPRGTRISGWRAKLEQSPTGAEPFDRAFAQLQQLASAQPEARHLIHADLLNFNVLVDGPRVSAVLDWGSAMFGDWLFDVAWFTFWQPWYPAWSSIDFAGEARAYFGLSAADFDQRKTCCELVIGLGNQSYCAWRGEERWPQLEEVARRTLALSESI